jgi:hypothetical protein
MSANDYFANSTPPLCPGDLEVRNITTNKYGQNLGKLVLPTYTTSLLPSSTKSPVGTLVLNISTNQLNYVSTSHTWLSIASA